MENTTEVKLTAAEKAEQKFLMSTFKGQLTEQGLEDLRAKYPSDVVVDMTDEANFKAARKARTERNKLVEAINRRRIDFTNNLKAHGDSLVSEVNSIFDTVVIPFEAEDKRQKDEAARIKREHEEMLNGQRDQLKDIKGFIDTAKATDDTDEISSLIDAVSNIEPEDFHKDIVHEVMQTLKEVSKELTDILMQKIESNRLKAEAEAAEKARVEAEAAAAEAKRVAEEAAAEAKKKADEEAAEAKRIADEEAAEAKRVADAKLAAEAKRSKIASRLNKLQMIPLDLMGKTAKEINTKLHALNKYEIPQEDFDDRYQEAVTAKATVIANLEKMLEQALMMEQFAAEQAPAIPEPTIEPEPEYTQQQTEVTQQQSQASNPDEVLASMQRASDLLPENQAQEQEAVPATLVQDLEAWYHNFGITEDAYNALMATLQNHNVQL